MSYYYKLSVSVLSLTTILFIGNVKSQNGLSFDGVNDFIQTTFPGVTGTNDRTFEAWVNINPGAVGNNTILDYGTNAVGSRNTFNVNGNLGLTFTSGGTNANLGSTNNSIITAGTWTHVAFVLDNGTGYLYVNGVLEGTGNLSAVNTPTTGTDMIIGERVTGGSIPMDGVIDELRVWNVARTAAEINQFMNQELCSIPTGLVAYFKLDEGAAGGTNAGVTVANNSVNGAQSGALTNFALSGATSNWVSGATLSSGSTSSSITVNSCGPFSFPGDTVQYSQPGVYVDTIPNVTGCDSIITLNLLSVSPNGFATISATACESYTSPSGNFTFTADGTYMDTISSASGCDSILTINLDIQRSFATYTSVGCEDFTLPSGILVNASGQYQDTITNSFGCDSIMTINVILLGSTTTNQEITSCFQFTSPSGKVFTSTGQYVDTLTSVNGCDSIINYDLTINSFNLSIVETSGALLSSVVSGVYQWYDCENDVIIAGQTNSSFVPASSGVYSVIVQKNGCTDTADCITFNKVGIENVQKSTLARIYPNPAVDVITIDLLKNREVVSIKVYSLDGKQVKYYNTENKQTILVGELNSGLYFVQITDKNGDQQLEKLVIE
ncbi:MAG: T9SS type A sorting domain-containing protein [Salibacteraceae bacterium]|jgi:hypothetical protein|nr:T9SS type A sorting domain-containing protein [Salibacteraceae bacterium]